MQFIRKGLVLVSFLSLLFSVFGFVKIRALSTSDVSTSVLIGTDWGTPIDTEIRYTNVYDGDIIFASMRTKQTIFFTDSVIGHDYYLVLTETDVDIYQPDEYTYGPTHDLLDHLHISITYDKNRYQIVDYLTRDVDNTTTFSAFLSLAVSQSGLNLGVSVSMSEQNSDLEFSPVNDFVNGSYTNLQDFGQEDHGTITLYEAVVFDDLAKADSIGFTSTYKGSFMFVINDTIHRIDSNTLTFSITKPIVSNNFIDDGLNTEFNELLSTSTGTTAGSWVKYGSDEQTIINTEYGGYVNAVKSIYYYNYMGEQYYLVQIYTESTPDIEDTCYPDKMSITIQGDTYSEIVAWSPKSVIGSTTHTAQFSANTKQIGASFGNAYSVSQIQIVDRTDRYKRFSKVEYDFDKDISTSSIRQYTAVIFKDSNSDYSFSTTVTIDVTYRDKWGLFDWFTRESEGDPYEHVTNIAITELYDKAQMKLNDDLENLQNIYIQSGTKKRLMINSLYTGQIVVEATKWNSTSSAELHVYNSAGQLITVSYLSGTKGAYSKLQFNATKNFKYYIEVTGYYGVAETDCTLSVKYSNLLEPDMWNTNESFSQNYVHDRSEFQPLIIDSFGAFTLKVQTSQNIYYPTYYYNTYVYVYDDCGNILRYNDNNGTSFYSLIENLYISSGQRLVVIVGAQIISTGYPIAYKLTVTK